MCALSATGKNLGHNVNLREGGGVGGREGGRDGYEGGGGGAEIMYFEEPEGAAAETTLQQAL